MHKAQETAGEAISTVGAGHAGYPPLLAQIYQPPEELYFRGSLPEVFSGRVHVAIVGTRRSDRYGEAIARELGTAVAAAGGVVVSGLAYGIDAAAHAGALSTGRADVTIAVLGSGVDRIYPAGNSKIASQIISGGGAVLSIVAPGTPPYPANFLARNRVIAGLSVAVVVVQAAHRSGALSTARHALESGRDIYVVPNEINNPRATGSNRLLTQGAAPLVAIDDFCSELGLVYVPAASGKQPTTGGELAERLVSFLGSEREMSVAEVGEHLGVSLAEAEQLVSLLEIDGILVRLPGGLVGKV